MKPLISFIENGIQIDREMNDEEYTQYLIDQEKSNLYQQKQQEELNKIEAKNNAKREALKLVGLSEDAIDAILS